MEKLDDTQLKAFDYEFIDDIRWETIKGYIERDFPDRQFTFLDMGGGNGNFADRILRNYPNSQGIVFDNSRLLLDRNKPNSRKKLIFDSAENLEHYSNEKFDLVTFNLVLHHLVSHSSYSESLENINRILRLVKTILTEGGRVSIFEQMFIGLFLDVAPSWIIYQLTSQKTIANLVRKCGANTAGVGVCFLSFKQWCSTIKRIGFHFEYTEDHVFPVPWIWKTFLNIGRFQSGFFWLRALPMKM